MKQSKKIRKRLETRIAAFDANKGATSAGGHKMHRPGSSKKKSK